MFNEENKEVEKATLSDKGMSLLDSLFGNDDSETEDEVIKSEKDAEVFFDSIDNTSEPNENLKSAASSYMEEQFRKMNEDKINELTERVSKKEEEVIKYNRDKSFAKIVEDLRKKFADKIDIEKAPEDIKQQLEYYLNDPHEFVALFFNEVKEVRAHQEKLLLIGCALVGIGWGVTLSATYQSDGMISQTTLLTIIIICGMHAGTFILFHIHPYLFLSYLIPAAGIPTLYSLFIIDSLQDFSLFLLIIIYNIFLATTAPLIMTRYLLSLRHEYQLVEERDKVAGLMNAFPGIVSLLDENLHYKMMNSFGHKLFKDINIINQPVGFMNDNHFGQMVHNFSQGHKQSLSSEIQLSTPTGKHWALINMSKLSHPENWIVIATIFIDDLVNARNELAKEKLKADSTARLASLGEMAQGIAHEINNPLSVVLFSAEELSQRARAKNFVLEFY
jgi:hypothetical protein